MSRILVVDDKEMMRDSVATLLGRRGHTIVAASGGEQALEKVAGKDAVKGAPGDASDAISETSNDADSESTAMIPTGGAPPVPSRPAPAPSRPAPVPSAKPALPPIGGKEEWPSAMPKPDEEEDKKEDKE